MDRAAGGWPAEGLGTTMDVPPSICPHYHVNGGREGEGGHVAAGQTPHMLPSGAARVPPPCLGALNPSQDSPPPAPNRGRRGSHLPFSALKRLQGPALLTRGDPSPIPASPVCPSPPSLLPSHSPGYGVAAPGGDAGGPPRRQAAMLSQARSHSCLGELGTCRICPWEALLASHSHLLPGGGAPGLGCAGMRAGGRRKDLIRTLFLHKSSLCIPPRPPSCSNNSRRGPPATTMRLRGRFIFLMVLLGRRGGCGEGRWQHAPGQEFLIRE